MALLDCAEPVIAQILLQICTSQNRDEETAVKRILLCVDGSVFDQSTYRRGAWLAERLDAEITVLHVTNAQKQAQTEAANFSGSIGFDASDTLLKQLVELEHQKSKLEHQQAKQILQSAEAALQQLGVSRVKTLHKTGALVDCLPQVEGDVDLIVLGKRGKAAELSSGHLGANLERSIRASRQPCLVTSRQFSEVERVLVAYDGSKTGQKMLQTLLASPIFQGVDLHLVKVVKERAEAGDMAQLEEAVKQAKAAGFSASGELLTGHAEAELARYIDAHQINLMCMGAYGHSRIRHLVIGSTTAQILRSSHIPVLVYR